MRIILPLFILSILFCGCNPKVFLGKVFDQRSEEMIEDVNVSLFDSTGQIASTRSNSEGEFIFRRKQIKNLSKYGIRIKAECHFIDSIAFTTTNQDRHIYEFALSSYTDCGGEDARIYFKLNSKKLNRKLLKPVIKILENNPQFGLQIFAIGDSTETDELQNQRNEKVYQALVDKGVNKSRLKINNKRNKKLSPTEENKKVYVFFMIFQTINE
jgi:hypothetical protein